MSVVTKDEMIKVIDRQVNYLQGERKKNALVAQQALNRYPKQEVDMNDLSKFVQEVPSHANTTKDAQKMVRVVFNLLTDTSDKREKEELLKKARKKRKPLASVMKKVK